MFEQADRELLQNLDRRVTQVEQILPSLSTRAETREATRDAVAPLPTREEMHAAIATAVAPLATREEMREEGERTRRYMEVLTERLSDDIHPVAEGVMALDKRDARQHAETVRRFDAVEARVACLEAGRRPGRR